MQAEHSLYADRAKSATINQVLWQTQQLHGRITATMETTDTTNMKETTVETTDTANMKKKKKKKRPQQKLNKYEKHYS